MLKTLGIISVLALSLTACQSSPNSQSTSDSDPCRDMISSGMQGVDAELCQGKRLIQQGKKFIQENQSNDTNGSISSSEAQLHKMEQLNQAEARWQKVMQEQRALDERRATDNVLREAGTIEGQTSSDY